MIIDRKFLLTCYIFSQLGRVEETETKWQRKAWNCVRKWWGILVSTFLHDIIILLSWYNPLGPKGDQHQFSPNNISNWLPKGEHFDLKPNSQKKCMEISLENLYVDLGTERDNWYANPRCWRILFKRRTHHLLSRSTNFFVLLWTVFLCNVVSLITLIFAFWHGNCYYI